MTLVTPDQNLYSAIHAESGCISDRAVASAEPQNKKIGFERVVESNHFWHEIALYSYCFGAFIRMAVNRLNLWTIRLGVQMFC